MEASRDLYDIIQNHLVPHMPAVSSNQVAQIQPSSIAISETRTKTNAMLPPGHVKVAGGEDTMPLLSPAKFFTQSKGSVEHQSCLCSFGFLVCNSKLISWCWHLELSICSFITSPVPLFDQRINSSVLHQLAFLTNSAPKKNGCFDVAPFFHIFPLFHSFPSCSMKDLVDLFFCCLQIVYEPPMHLVCVCPWIHPAHCFLNPVQLGLQLSFKTLHQIGAASVKSHWHCRSCGLEFKAACLPKQIDNVQRKSEGRGYFEEKGMFVILVPSILGCAWVRITSWYCHGLS